MEKDETMEAIPFHTDAERVSAAFQRNDNLNSNLYEIAKRFLFGYVLLATPLRFFFVFAGSFYFYLWLITWQWLYRIGIVSYLVHQKMIQMAGRQGLRFVMLLIGVYWIDRHQISVEDMRRIVRTVRRQTNTECPEDDNDDQQQQYSQRYENDGQQHSTQDGDSNFATVNGEDEKHHLIPECWRNRPPPIIVTNHLSYFDPFIIMDEFGVCSVVGKSALKHMFVIGKICDALDSLYVGQGVTEELKERAQSYYSADLNNLPKRFLIYPEGTTTIGSHFLKFHKGAFSVGVPVQPVVVRFPFKSFNPAWSGDISNFQYYSHVSSQFHIPVALLCLQPYFPNKKEIENPSLYAENVRRVMCAAHNLVAKQNDWPMMQLSKELYVRRQS